MPELQPQGPKKGSVLQCRRSATGARERCNDEKQRIGAKQIYVGERAAEISDNVAFSASLTATPPNPKNPPSVPASAAFCATPCSHVRKAAASLGAFAPRSLKQIAIRTKQYSSGRQCLRHKSCLKFSPSRGPPVTRGEILGNSFYQGVRLRVLARFDKCPASSHALLYQSPDATGVGGGNGHAGDHRTTKKFAHSSM